MKLKKTRIKLYGHSGIGSGARCVQGGTFFDNRMRYVMQSKRTTNGVAAELPTREELENEKQRLFGNNDSRFRTVDSESSVRASFIARESLFRPKVICS